MFSKKHDMILLYFKFRFKLTNLKIYIMNINNDIISYCRIIKNSYKLDLRDNSDIIYVVL